MGLSIVANVVCFLVIATVSPQWFTLRQVGEVEIYDGLERLGRSAGLSPTAAARQLGLGRPTTGLLPESD